MNEKKETTLEIEYRTANEILDYYNVSRITEYSLDEDHMIFGVPLSSRIDELVNKEKNDYLKKVEETKKIIIAVIQTMLLDKNTDQI